MRSKKQSVCEFCFKPINHRNEGTVCNDCDAEMERAETEKTISLSLNYASKHKCRECGAGLTIGRYFKCIDCKPELPPESDFEQCDDMDAA
jgi:hypothetical protein